MGAESILSQDTQKTLIRELLGNQLHLRDDVVMDLGTPEMQKLRAMLFSNSYIDTRIIRNVVHERLVDVGKRMHKIHADSLRSAYIIYPNRLFSPHAFGYAIKHASLLLATIRFNNSENAEEYIRMADGLLEKVIDQLSNPLTRAQSMCTSQESDNEPCCIRGST